VIVISGGELLKRSGSDAGRRAFGGRRRRRRMRRLRRSRRGRTEVLFYDFTNLQSLMHRKTLEDPSFILLHMSALR